MLGHFGMIPLINHDSRVRENSEVVINCPQVCVVFSMSAMTWKILGPSNYHLVMTNIAMENDPFIDGLPIKNGDFPWLC